VRGYSGLGYGDVHLNRHDLGEATGILVARGDAEHMARAIRFLLKRTNVRIQLGLNAAKDAHNRFDMDREVSAYLEWYEELFRIWSNANGVENRRSRRTER